MPSLHLYGIGWLRSAGKKIFKHVQWHFCICIDIDETYGMGGIGKNVMVEALHKYFDHFILQAVSQKVETATGVFQHLMMQIMEA